MSNRITHIRKPNVDSSVEHITHVKGTNSNGVFEYPVSTVIQYIKQGYEFYVQAGSEKAIVTYQRSAYGNEYIKTKPDSTRRDNLLSLPQF